MIRRNEPDPNEGDVEPEEPDEAPPQLYDAYELAIDHAKQAFTEYPANEETYRTMCVFIRVYMYERGYDLEVKHERVAGVLTFVAVPRGKISTVVITGSVSP